MPAGPKQNQNKMERQKHHVLKIPTTSKILLKTCSLDLDAPHVPQPSSSVQFIGHGGFPRLHGFPTRCLREYFDGPEKPGGRKTTMWLTTNPLKKIFWWRKSSELVPKYVHADEKDRPGRDKSYFGIPVFQPFVAVQSVWATCMTQSFAVSDKQFDHSWLMTYVGCNCSRNQ